MNIFLYPHAYESEEVNKLLDTSSWECVFLIVGPVHEWENCNTKIGAQFGVHSSKTTCQTSSIQWSTQHSVFDQLTAWPSVKWYILCFPTKLAVTSQPYNHVMPVGLPVEPQSLITPMIRKGLGNRTLPKLGYWRSAGTCSATKGVDVFPCNDPWRNNQQRTNP